jgi:hypothetical protein
MSKLGFYYSSVGRQNITRSWKLSWLQAPLDF